MANGWLSRLKSGLSRSSGKLAGAVTLAVTGRKLDAAMLRDLEDSLIAADLGPAAAVRLREALADKKFGRTLSDAEARGVLAEEIARLLQPISGAMTLTAATPPHVVLVAGVNGVGKTTTIAKLAYDYKQRGKTVMLVAGDTFRAAAIQQLTIWGQRAGCPVFARAPGADPAGLAFDALTKARANGIDLLLIDTAGRLHNRKDLMAEMEKIIRVLRKLDPTAPHDTILVLDAATGQNTLDQVRTFQERLPLSGLILTKLDGSARGGILVALAQDPGLPVYAIGVGEGLDDMRPFDARAYARNLMGLDMETI